MAIIRRLRRCRPWELEVLFGVFGGKNRNSEKNRKRGQWHDGI